MFPSKLQLLDSAGFADFHQRRWPLRDHLLDLADGRDSVRDAGADVDPGLRWCRHRRRSVDVRLQYHAQPGKPHHAPLAVSWIFNGTGQRNHDHHGNTACSPYLDDAVYHRCHGGCWPLLRYVAHHQLAHGCVDLLWLVHHAACYWHRVWMLDGHHHQCSSLRILGIDGIFGLDVFSCGAVMSLGDSSE